MTSATVIPHQITVDPPIPHWKRPLLRPPIGSEVRLESDPDGITAIIFMVTLTENFLRYKDGRIINLDSDSPFSYVGFSDPANWYDFTRILRFCNTQDLTGITRNMKTSGHFNSFKIPSWKIQIYDGKLVDGRCRLHAANLAGVKPEYAEIASKARRAPLTELDLITTWYSNNLIRRGCFTCSLGLLGVKIEDDIREYKRALRAAKTSSSVTAMIV